MKNRFQYTLKVSNDNFCGREKEIQILHSYINNSQNILLYSKRRVGKSSLIQELYSNHISDDIIKVYLDIYDIVTPYDFANYLYKAIADALPFDMVTSISKLKDIFSKTSFSATITKNGEFKLKPEFITKDFEEIIDDALGSFSNYLTKTKQQAVLTIDEFQQISLIKDKKIDALLRKYIQEHTNISYIFTGSKKHLLTSLFINQSSPLYEMANHMELKNIDEEVFFKFVNDKLNNKISAELFNYIYNIANGESKLIQNICYHLYELEKESCITDDIDEIINFILDEMDGSFRILFDRLTITKKAILKLISSCNGIDIYKKEKLVKFNLEKNQITSNIKNLYEKDELIEYQDNKQIIIQNRTFELWIKRLVNN
ncbi:MAG: ATP-binding protein [Campylobacterota bacterium]|nr:ATP-binding protein [Campylobacterota bacterium]